MLDKEALDKYSKQIDYHLGSLRDLTAGLIEVKQSIDELRLSQESGYLIQLKELQANQASLVKQLEKIGLPKMNTYEMQLDYVKKKLNEDWPEAIDPEVIYTDKGERASNIMTFIVTEYMEGLRFLDYKCGSGHVVQEAASRHTSITVGYDESKEWEFDSTEKVIYTSEFEQVRSMAPFDVILLYDVLDHIDNPVQTLQQIRQLLSDRGRIYLRCHPWSSRTGGHLHEKINKAYLHLVLDDVELTRIGGYKTKYSNKVTQPLYTYRKWIEDASLKVEQELPIIEPMEDYFLNDAVLLDRVQKYWKDDDIQCYTSIQFVDYVLCNNELNRKIF